MNNRWKTLSVSLLVSLGAGLLSAVLSGDMAGRYRQLRLPPGAPPAGVFPAVWTVLYLLMGVSAFLKKEGIPAPVFNIPGCPPHPDWIVGTIGLGLQALATNTLDLLVKQGLDANGRPKAFYKNVHMNCPHLSEFEAGHMVKTMSDKDGCRFSMGCKGPRSACDSFERKWNNGVNWCVNNATCIGCTSPTFPDGQSPFYVN